MPSYDDLPHLVGLAVPAGVELSFVPGTAKDLASFAREGPLVIHTFPGIGWWADAPQVSDLDAAQEGDFRAYDSEFADLGYRILGITAQPLGELHKRANREKTSHFLASDGELRLADALALPTVSRAVARARARARAYERLTLIVRDGRIRKVFYPVAEPNHPAGEVLSWLYQVDRGR
jgi:peroxiredoxin